MPGKYCMRSPEFSPYSQDFTRLTYVNSIVYCACFCLMTGTIFVAREQKWSGSCVQHLALKGFRGQGC
jgi:hypothetical protein